MFINTYMNTTITAAQFHVKHLDALFCDGEKKQFSSWFLL